VAAAIKLSKPSVKVIGVEPELAGDAQASLRAGKIVHFPAADVSRTIADGLRTQSVGPINFEHIRRYVDDIITVSEDEIREAVKVLAANPKTVAEPSGAVAAAGFFFHGAQLPRTKLNVAIISGAISILRCWKSCAARNELRRNRRSGKTVGRLLLWTCRDRPAPYRDHRPHGLNQSERPRTLQKAINRAEQACHGKGQNEPSAARFEGVADQHGCDCEQTEYG